MRQLELEGSTASGTPCRVCYHHWPKDMAAVFDLAKTRIGNKRDQVEDALRERVDKFEGKVNKASKDLDLFMRKDPPVLTMDEMRTSSSTIDK